MKFLKLSLLLIPVLLSSCNDGLKPSSSTSQSKDNIDISFVALNDFHGIIEPRNDREVGLEKIASYLKNKKNEGYVLLNSGDSYQGTFLAGYDYGETISKVFKDIDFDAYTIGNHEFDWGIEKIKRNEEVLGKKFLGANIYSYPNKEKSLDLGESYTIKVLNEGTENEVKIGIIGVIGEDQITSITSTHVKDLFFMDSTPIIENLSSELREEQGCDIVIADYHASIDQVDYYEVSEYVDAVFLGHSHQQTYDEYNGVPFIQGGRYGEAVSEITLSFNKSSKKVTNKSHKIQRLNQISLTKDENAKQIIDELRKVADPVGNETIGYSDQYVDNQEMSCFYSKLCYEKVTEEGYNVDFVLFNVSRYSLNEGYFTYSNLYETNPFKNKLYILSINGYSIYREAYRIARQYGYNPNELSITSLEDQRNTWYDVLVYDYNGFHIGIDENNEKYYDQFACAFTGGAKHTPILVEGYEALDIAVNYLKDKENPTISRSDYSGSKFINY